MTALFVIADEIDEVRAYARWLLSEEPSRAWQAASFVMWSGNRKPLRWMARHLRIDAGDPRAWFALAGFAPMEISGAWRIAACVPAPDPFDADASPGNEVVIVDPETKSAAMLGDTGSALILPEPQPESLFVHADPMAWLREWADHRVVFFEHRRQAIEKARIVPTFSGEPPSALAIGAIDTVPWSRIYARTIKADFQHHKAIKRAIFRAADLPRVEAA